MSFEPMVVTINNEGHVSVPDAARMKSVTRQAIWEACRSKRLPSVQRGRFLYIPLSELRRWRPQGGANRAGPASDT